MLPHRLALAAEIFTDEELFVVFNAVRASIKAGLRLESHDPAFVRKLEEKLEKVTARPPSLAVSPLFEDKNAPKPGL